MSQPELQTDDVSDLPQDPVAIAGLLAHPALPRPLTPLYTSYTYHSPTPASTSTEGRRFLLGIDEAGRGPALGGR